MSTEKVNIDIYSIVCSSVILVSLGVSSLVIGIVNEYNECQHSTRGGLTLSDWNKIVGIEKLVTVFTTFLLIVFLKKSIDVGSVTAIVLLFLEQILCVILYVWGIVLVSTNENNSCVGTDMGVFSIVNLGLATLGFWSFHFAFLKTE